MCLLCKMVDGVQAVCRLQTPLTNTENRLRANRMEKVDPGRIKCITSQVTRLLYEPRALLDAIKD